MKYLVVVSWLVLLLFGSCRQRSDNALFERMSSSQTGITFANQLSASDSLNILKFEYMYNGGGVGVGDLNNDGLTDVFFAGNQVSSKLYLNRGNFKFEDITLPAGVATQTWCTGVAMIDINQDQKLDIYVSTIYPYLAGSSQNLLFINQGVNADGVPVFKESATLVGLADTSYSTQAAFLDYDRDGDLDVYLLTNALETFNRNSSIGQRQNGTGRSVDKLFRNEGNDSRGLPIFKDVSKESGILIEGWGLGVIVNDFNEDGYPDIYVGNDFLSNDHLYINNKNGTFSNQIANYLRHQSHNSMGLDMADINNDGYNDLVVVDMLPDDNLRQKTMFNFIDYDKFQQNLRMKYQPQYVRNVLQLNNGNGTFSDIGYLAGVAATDWSWSPLLADLDNDGFRDLLITNGYRLDITDMDFIVYRSDHEFLFDQKKRMQKLEEAFTKLKGVKKPNFFFRNNGDLTFTNIAAETGLQDISYTNGTAYADLDNDGDLDLIMNNVDDEAFVYKNKAIENQTANKNPSAQKHFLRLKLAGEKPNWQGIGAKISVYYQNKMQYAEHSVIRGYKSTVENVVHFGLGSAQQLDSLVIVWPAGKKQVMSSVKADTVLTIYERNATRYATVSNSSTPLFKEVSQDCGIDYLSTEVDYIDFKLQNTIPHKFSQSGPGLAVGDVNGDGLDDFFIGGSAHNSGALFTQTPASTFTKKEFIAKDQEDTGVLLFDADRDGDNDLYCVSGSSEFGKNVQKYQDRLYKNDGKGNFTLATNALPAITSSGSCVVGCDYDKDGDIDLFVGGRVMPMQYPYTPESYLLRNDGTGTFENATQIVGSELQKPGMVTSALWTDYDNDGWTDLILAGEFMPILLFKNEKGKTFHRSEIPNSAGWWNSLAAGDFDNDGDMDYIAGNLGLNSRLKASPKEPVSVYAKDFDESGTVDPLITCYNYGKEYAIHPRGTLIDQLIAMRRRFKTFAEYGSTPFPEMLPTEHLKDAITLRATEFSSVYIENRGKGSFLIHALPVEAQFSPLFGLVVTDINQDGNLDILGVGNDYSAETLSGLYDAGVGICLQGDGRGHFKAMPIRQSGFFVNGDAKALATTTLANGKRLFIATQNQGYVKAFELNNSIFATSKTMHIQPDDASVEITLADGRRQKQEFYYGTTYLSQSSRTCYLPSNTREITITSTKNIRRKVADPVTALAR